MRSLAIVVALLGGCDWFMGLHGFKPTATDATAGDGSDANAPDSANCLGAMSICLTPTSDLDITAKLDIDTGASQCMAVVSMSTHATTELCVLMGTNISVGAPIRATGTRALVLFATGDIIVGAGQLIDVSSHLGGTIGAAGDSMACGLVPGVPGSTAGAGGGAGGSFQGKGGDGGGGRGGMLTGGSATQPVTQPSQIRGGCPGMSGGTGTGAAGEYGHGGGAVYLVAGGSIAIAGAIAASGGGAAMSAGTYAGGSGGGSGGLIWLDAPMTTIDTSARLVALGGSGAAGSSNTGIGQAGQDPGVFTASPYAVGGTAPANAGAGGNGSSPIPGGVGTMGTYGGGGGGGGAGFIVYDHAHTILVTTSLYPYVP